MGKKDWTYHDVDPERDYSFAHIARLTNITTATLYNWKAIGRLVVYDGGTMSRGEWVIRAMRSHTPMTQSKMRQEHRERYPHREAARIAVAKAIYNGELTRGACEVCGTTEQIEAHHPDYSKQLEVEWLCRQHHTEFHRNNPTPQKRRTYLELQSPDLTIRTPISLETYQQIKDVAANHYEGKEAMFIRKVFTDYFLKYPEKGIESENS